MNKNSWLQYAFYSFMGALILAVLFPSLLGFDLNNQNKSQQINNNKLPVKQGMQATDGTMQGYSGLENRTNGMLYRQLSNGMVSSGRDGVSTPDTRNNIDYLPVLVGGNDIVPVVIYFVIVPNSNETYISGQQTNRTQWNRLPVNGWKCTHSMNDLPSDGQ